MSWRPRFRKAGAHATYLYLPDNHSTHRIEMVTLSYFPVIFKTLIHADLRLLLRVNFYTNQALFISFLFYLPIFPLACTASTHSVAPFVQPHTLRLLVRYIGDGPGCCCWLLPVVKIAVKIYNLSNATPQRTQS